MLLREDLYSNYVTCCVNVIYKAASVRMYWS